jgi:nicotinate-nucleotide pyrophosphorylase
LKKDFTPEDELLFLALGGSGEIGMNVNLYGCRGKWLMVDLGMTFSGDEYPGVDLVFADLDFIEERRDDLLGVVLTHAHEDHIGAIPYFAEELGVPLYATPFTAELIRRKLQEAGIAGRIELNIIEEDHGSIELGPFEITYIPLAHSIAEGNALLSETPCVRGPLRALLCAERTALNFLMRLCGVATLARRYVEEVAGTGCEIVDTRKTLPGWRTLDKYAVATGGATNHRSGLYDGIRLKDNHIAVAGGVLPALKAALADAPAGLRVQLEVESEEDAVAAVEAGADFLLLDNCAPPVLRAIASRLRGRAVLEASGGVHLGNVREVAETGVHRISIGALTHSAPAADLALEIAAGGEPDGGATA